jgi:hypothetical protein
MIKRLAAGLGVTVFLVLAGTAAGYAYWSATAQVSTSVTIGDAAAANCVNPVKLENSGFETPDIGTATISNPATIPGWKIDPRSSNPQFELWTAWDGISAPVGDQMLELNGNGPDISYQELSVLPGQVLHWSLLHHGRWGNDTMYVAIDPVGSSSYTYQIPAGASTSAITTGTAAWVRYSGTYTVPATQAVGVKTRFALVPGTTTSTRPGETVTNGSVGNLVDDISFGTGPCLDTSSTIANLNTSKAGLEPGDTAVVTTTISNLGTGIASGTVLTLPISPTVGSLSNVQIDGAAAGTRATLSGSTLTVRIGTGANGSVGGTIGSDTTVEVTYRALVTGALGDAVSTTPTLHYADAQIPGWPLVRTGTTVNVTIADATPPSVPGTPTLTTTGPTTVNLSWTASTGGVDHYEVERLTSTGTWQRVSPLVPALTGTSWTDTAATGLTPGQAYAYRIVAKDAAGNSATSSGHPMTLTHFGTGRFQIAWMYGSTPVCIDNDGGAAKNVTTCNSAQSAQQWTFSQTTGSTRVTSVSNGRVWLQSRSCVYNYCYSTSTNVSVASGDGDDADTWIASAYWNGTNPFVRFMNATTNDYVGVGDQYNNSQLRVYDANNNNVRNFVLTPLS